jgi:FkbM family methyltransferase
MSLLGVVRKILRKMGVDLVRYSYLTHPIARKMYFVEETNINIVLDVGANKGQYAYELRQVGYSNKIISFEPLSEAYAVLERQAHKDVGWSTFNIALGDQDGLVDINISQNSQSSSLLNMHQKHSDAAPESKYYDKEQVTIKRLDSIIEDISSVNDRIYLKIDAQGFEKQVLSGAKESFDRVEMIQIESALVPLYEGETLFFEMNAFLYECGYYLVSIDPPAFIEPVTGELLQIDAIYRKVR